MSSLRDQIAEAIHSGNGTSFPWRIIRDDPDFADIREATYRRADAVMAVVEPEIERLRADQRAYEVDVLDVLARKNTALEKAEAKVAQLTAFLERVHDDDAHMRFGLIHPDGTTEMMACADWCTACKLQRARLAADQAEAEVAALREQISDEAKAALKNINRWRADIQQAEAERDALRATVERVRLANENMRGWCSPYGYVIHCADHIDEALGKPEGGQ